MSIIRKNLCVFVDQEFWERGSFIATTEAFTNFFEGFEPYFDKIFFYGRHINSESKEMYRLNKDKYGLFHLPAYHNTYSLVRKGPSFFLNTHRTFVSALSQWDLALICIPHPLALWLTCICLLKKKKFIFLVRQNLMEQVRHRNKGLKRIFSMGIVYLLEFIFRRLAQKHLTFTVGSEMLRAYKKTDAAPVFPVVISLISKKQIISELPHNIHEKNRMMKLLNVGRIDPEKGLHHLLKALSILVKRGNDISLILVGNGSEEENLKRLSSQLGLTGRVVFKGYVPYGAELLDIYKDSDLFVLPSLTGEGLPQVLVEAMANGLPIIATRVAGIPSFVSNGEDGILIEPGDPEEIVRAITVMEEPEKRNKFAEAGLEKARRTTRESQVSMIMESINNYYSLND